MVSEADAILEFLGGTPSKVRIISGYYRGLSGLRVLVDFDNGRVPAHPVTSYRPVVNEPVWVAVVDGVAYMLGPTVPKPADGEIVSASSGNATVSTDIGNVSAEYDEGLLSLSPGDDVKLMWGNGCWIVGVSNPAAPPAPTPAPGQGGGRRTVTFTAIDSGSWQSGYGWRTNDVWSSASNKGGWFYGSKIRDTIPDAASIHAASVYLPGPYRLLGARPFGYHPYDTKPGGEPIFSSTSTLSGTSGWVPIPTGLINHLKSNPGGLGFDFGGYNIWPGRQVDGQSGAVRVTYDT